MSVAEAGDDQLAANKAVVIEFYDAFDRGDFDRVRELVDPDGTWRSSSRSSRKLWDSVRRIQVVHEASKDGVHFTVGMMTAEDDRVAVVVESHADMLERGPYHNLYHNLFRVLDGRIVEVTAYNDTAEVEGVLLGKRNGVGPIASLTDDPRA